ncbi:hypothetical protein WR25_15152 [Diploscapter pachys]|uniref:Partial AB-hydrolase lipase domain-containing protein n=1 Tax=Diploscapter pachys TaxID=2018661 RepID=A0A2A2K468_9BILA|nr:hypothetical protein WR25_15152 [Diploscapter pachys]
MQWSAALSISSQLLLIWISRIRAIDPECYMTVPEITKYYDYISEVHIVRTEDDYLLELHRIKSKTAPTKPDGVVFMQHGLLADGFNFTPNLKNESAGFVFADAGFDVWIGNSRGTPASQKHIGYGPEDDRFWNFTFQEMSQYDLTACVKYILKETKQNGLYYIGHSQGTVIMFAKLSEDPEFAKKIYQFHALAPVATVSHIGGLFKLMGNKFLTVAQVN